MAEGIRRPNPTHQERGQQNFEPTILSDPPEASIRGVTTEQVFQLIRTLYFGDYAPTNLV